MTNNKSESITPESIVDDIREKVAKIPFSQSRAWIEETRQQANVETFKMVRGMYAQNPKYIDVFIENYHAAGIINNEVANQGTANVLHALNDLLFRPNLEGQVKTGIYFLEEWFKREGEILDYDVLKAKSMHKGFPVNPTIVNNRIATLLNGKEVTIMTTAFLQEVVGKKNTNNERKKEIEIDPRLKDQVSHALMDSDKYLRMVWELDWDFEYFK